MEERRRNRGEYRNPYQYQSGPKSFARSQYRKPPPPPPEYCKPDVPAWIASVPSWERKFVINVGNMPWGRFVHCQKGLELYTDIFQWDDSAGAEAFHNAKSRFWAVFNGRHYDIPFPDPDMYLSKIDWYAKTDPELYKDLDKVDRVPEEEEKDTKAQFVGNSPYYTEQPIVPTGWGDEDTKAGDNNESNKDNPWLPQSGWDGSPWGTHCLSSLMKPIILSGCVDEEVDPSKTNNNVALNNGLQYGANAGNKNIPRESNNGGWEGVGSSSNKNNPWESNNGGWEGVDNTSNNNNPWETNGGGWKGVPWGVSSLNTTNGLENLNYSMNSGSLRGGNENWRKRENEGQQLSRYKTTRYHGDGHQPDHGWRNNRGKKNVSFAHQHSPVEPLSQRQWNSVHTCGPIDRQRPAEAGNSWGW